MSCKQVSRMDTTFRKWYLVRICRIGYRMSGISTCYPIQISILLVLYLTTHDACFLMLTCACTKAQI